MNESILTYSVSCGLANHKTVRCFYISGRDLLAQAVLIDKDRITTETVMGVGLNVIYKSNRAVRRSDQVSDSIVL